MSKPVVLFSFIFSAQINEKAYHRAADELTAVKREAVELKVSFVSEKSPILFCKNIKKRMVPCKSTAEKGFI